MSLNFQMKCQKKLLSNYTVNKNDFNKARRGHDVSALLKLNFYFYFKIIIQDNLKKKSVESLDVFNLQIMKEKINLPSNSSAETL